MNGSPAAAGHDELRDDLAAYALHALPDDEARRLEAHLERCSSCREVLRWLTPAVDMLPAAVRQESPPASLRVSLMETVRAEAAPASASARKPGRLRGRLPALAGLSLRPAAGLAAVVLIIAGLGGGYLIRGSDTELRPVESTFTSAAAVGPQADQVSATLERQGDSATLHVHELPELARDKVYEVWVQRAGVMEPRSVFVLRKDGTAEAAVPGPLSGGEAVYVTTEESGGAQQPSLPAVLKAPL